MAVFTVKPAECHEQRYPYDSVATVICGHALISVGHKKFVGIHECESVKIPIETSFIIKPFNNQACVIRCEQC